MLSPAVNIETTTNVEKGFSATDFFAQWHETLWQLIYSTFGPVGTSQSKECMDKFALDVEAAATSLCVENGIPKAEQAEREQQLRHCSSMLVPILLTIFLAGHEPAVDVESSLQEDGPISLVGSGGGGETPKLARFCNSRLDAGDRFLRAGDCQGEVYLLPGAGVFKPELTKMATTRLRNGFKGSEHRREIAAFQVDKAYGGFARVPPTAAATIYSDSLPDRDADATHVVSGSLQKWVHSACASEDMGSSRFDMVDVHHIGILDVLLYNTDRHGGNMLVEKSASCGVSCGKGKSRLVPIDHGLCLPDFRHLDQAEFEWLYWKQAQQPLGKKDIQLIASFDGNKLAGILRGLGLSSGSVLTARIMAVVLQQTAIKHGWNLREIGSFCTKPFNGKSSDLADVVAATMVAAGVRDREVSFEDHRSFVDSFSKQLEQHLNGKIVVKTK